MEQEHHPRDKRLVQPPILDISQVAITMVYRYQPRAGAPIDAGKLVADTGKTGDYRYCTWKIVRRASLLWKEKYHRAPISRRLISDPLRTD